MLPLSITNCTALIAEVVLQYPAIKAFSVFLYSLAALLIFALEGKVDWIVGFWMVLGSIIGAWFSSIWSVRKGGEKVIRVTLLIMVTYMALKLWMDTFNN